MISDDCSSMPGGSEPPVTKPGTCRWCAKGVVRAFSLGDQACANDYLRPEDPAPERHPLAYAVCRACGLLQLEETVAPEALYSNYAYRTRGSLSVARHATDLSRRFGGPGKFVVEIASNDGAILEVFQRDGANVLGVEPAENIAADAEKCGVETVVDFFDEELGHLIAATYEKADVIFARNVFGHLPSPHSFLAGCLKLLTDDGVLIIEAPSLTEVYNHRDFTYAYHEHVALPGAWNMARLLGAHGLTLVEVVPIDIHGGSTQYQIRRRGTPGPSVLKMQAAESVSGALRESGWEAFFKDAIRNRERVVEGLTALRDQGLRVAGYTAPAKLSVLAQWARLTPDLLPVVFDTTPEKQGRLVPGTAIPIEDAERMPRYEPDVLFVGAHNLAVEIKKRWPKRRMFRAVPEWGEVS